jgi:DNA adenine methylase
MSIEAHPFLKWAGGKRQILDQLLAILPKQMETYYEPFVGGGAVFFALAAEGRFRRALLNDANRELMDCYQAIRSFPEDLIDQLGLWPVNKDTFTQVRAWSPAELSPIMRAARMIYLNKAGFNGLYRVNKKGEFNVPYGKWKRPPKVLHADNLRACSEVLNRFATLYCQDFAEVVGDTGPGDVVYFDPPYIPVSVTSNFTSYTSDGFTLDDQHRLAACFRELVQRGVKVVASNSDTETTRSLYAGFELNEIQSKRCINSKGDRRGFVRELIIVGRGKTLKPPKIPT